MTMIADQTAPTPGRRHLVAAGRISRPTRCTLTVPQALLTAYGYTDQADAHADGVCARLYGLARREQSDGAEVDGQPPLPTRTPPFPKPKRGLMNNKALPLRPTPHERDGRQPGPTPARPHPGAVPALAG